MTDAAPAHALLSAAHSLLRPAMHHGRDKPAAQPTDSLLPIEEAILPDDVTDLRDVVDAINKLCDTMKTSSYDADDEEVAPSIEDELREAIHPTQQAMYNITEEREREVAQVADDICEAWAVNQMAELANLDWPSNETVAAKPWSTSRTEEAKSETWPINETIEEINVTWPVSGPTEEGINVSWPVSGPTEEGINVSWPVSGPTEGINVSWPVSEPTEEGINVSWPVSGPTEEVYCIEQYGSQEWTEPVAQDLPGQTSEVTSEGEAVNWEAASELYYTASSEVSLVSDFDLPERTIEMDDSVCFSDLTEMPLLSTSVREQDEKNAECVVAGHVAAMRERFESLTRATTPCPDRTSTPALDLSRNVSPSPTQDQ